MGQIKNKDKDLLANKIEEMDPESEEDCLGSDQIKIKDGSYQTVCKYGSKLSKLAYIIKLKHLVSEIRLRNSGFNTTKDPSQLKSKRALKQEEKLQIAHQQMRQRKPNLAQQLEPQPLSMQTPSSLNQTELLRSMGEV